MKSPKRMKCHIPLTETYVDTNGKLFTVYDIRIYEEEETWTIQRRYRDFQTLDGKLKKIPEFQTYIKTIILPPKKVFGYMNPELIEERRVKLESYLNKVLGISDLAHSPPVLEFCSKEIKPYIHFTKYSPSKQSPSTPSPNRDDSCSDITKFWVKGMKLKTLCDHKGDLNTDELSFFKGDIVTFLEKKNEKYIKVDLCGIVGSVACNHVQLLPRFSGNLTTEKNSTPILRRSSSEQEKWLGHVARKSDDIANSQRTKTRGFLQTLFGSPTKQGNSPPAKMDSDLHMRRRKKKIQLEDFDVIDVIGKGGFGKVYLCREKFSGELVALKKIKKSVILERNKVEYIITERAVLKDTSSPWLVSLLCSFQDENYLYLAMEYAHGGNLKMLIQNVSFTERQSAFYIAEMILAVSHLHQLGFVHRDLKPDNFLLDIKGHIKLADFGLSKGGIIKKTETQQVIRVFMTDGNYKIIAIRSVDTAKDVINLMQKSLHLSKKVIGLYHLFIEIYGRERKLLPDETPISLLNDRMKFIFKRESEISFDDVEDEPEETNKLKSRRETAREMAVKYLQNSKKSYSFVGSPHYMAPEIIRKLEYNELVDWWSIGCISYEMIYGFPPFDGETPQEVFANILNFQTMLEFPEDEEFTISQEAKQFIQKTLVPSEKRICDIKLIKKFPFFAGINWDHLRDNEPPFVPRLTSETDTSYFHLTPEEKTACLSSDVEKSPIMNIPNSAVIVKKSTSYDVVGFSFESRYFRSHVPEKNSADNNNSSPNKREFEIRDFSDDLFDISPNSSQDYSKTSFKPSDFEDE